MIEDYIRRAVERAIRDAEHPSGMSTHDGKARVEASYLRRMLVMLSAAPTPPAQDDALELLRRVANHLSEVGNHGDSFGWRDALKDARALIAKRGAE